MATRNSRLRRRRAIVAIAAVAAADALVVGLRQIGVLRRLPDLPGRIWDSNAIVTSPAAYALGVPDAPVAAAGFCTIAALAGSLGRAAPRTRPAASAALFGAAGAAAAGAAIYLWVMLRKQRRLCPYCLTTAVASFALVPLAWPEVSPTSRS
jgi:uncharacterized membrane protein